jgi:hypothetical protein
VCSIEEVSKVEGRATLSRQLLYFCALNLLAFIALLTRHVQQEICKLNDFQLHAFSLPNNVKGKAIPGRN